MLSLLCKALPLFNTGIHIDYAAAWRTRVNLRPEFNTHYGKNVSAPLLDMLHYNICLCTTNCTTLWNLRNILVRENHPDNANV